MDFQTATADVTADVFNQLLAERNDNAAALAVMTADMKEMKDNVMKILTFAGMTDANGHIRQTLNMPKILGSLTPLLMGGERKIEKELGWLKECIPLLEKYQNL